MEHHRNNTNPRRQFKHYTAPSRMFWKSVRGMLPHKTPRGAAALQRMKLFDGMPYPYDHKKRMVVPDALKTLRMKSFRKSCVMGDLSKLAGWTKGDLVARLEERRKARAADFHKRKSAKLDARKKATGDKSVAAFNNKLATLGY